jgi:hypothetical protein
VAGGQPGFVVPLLDRRVPERLQTFGVGIQNFFILTKFQFLGGNLKTEEQMLLNKLARSTK